MMFLKAGSSLDKNTERPCPFRWMSDKVWLNVLAISRHEFGPSRSRVFSEVSDLLSRDEAAASLSFVADA